MKNLFKILLFVFSIHGFSQDSRIFENTWYLHDLVIDGISNIPPINEEIPFVPADFIENGELYTGMCDEGGFGELEYLGATEFEILSIVFFQGGCNPDYPYNQQYSSLYQVFWFDLSTSIVTYEITDDGQSRTLIITGINNDYAVYGDAILLSQENISKSKFSIYPTLVRNSFKINSISMHTVQSIIIYNLSGQKVLSVYDKESIVSVADLSAGMYFVFILDNNNIRTIKKIIKL